MSTLLARSRLAESRIALLSALGRGNGRHVRGGWLKSAHERTRKASWWKKSYDEGLGSDEFGLGSALRREEEERQSREMHKKTNELFRKKGWGLDDNEKEDGTKRARSKVQTVVHQTSSKDELSWSQSSEDMYWDATSRSVDDEQHVPIAEASVNRPWDISGQETQATSKDSASIWRSGYAGEHPIADRETQAAPENAAPIWRPVYGEAHEVPLEKLMQPTASIDYERLLSEALEEGDSDKVARCLYVAQKCLDFDFLNNISEATFTDILQLLAPRQNIQELVDAYAHVMEHMVGQLGLTQVGALTRNYSSMLYKIARLRSQSGHRLTSDQYLILLRSAKDLGDSHQATKFWKGLHQDNLVPDVDMYNAYLAAYVWAGYNNATARHRERVINVYLTARDEKRKDMPYENYHVGSPGGIKEKTMELLSAMLESGLTANEETYRSIITAAAREGEVDTVKSILSTVWHIDVSRLMELDAGHPRMPKPKALAKNSQQYPTSRLLWTIAHAFGMNNDIPTALRLVDYVSREYDVVIDEKVWEALFHWTFVLASPRSGTAVRDDRKTGQLPKEAVETLFRTMTTAPYLVKPNMDMYNRMIVNLFHRATSNKMYDMMKAGRSLWAKAIGRRNKAWVDLQWCLNAQDTGEAHPSVAIARREWETATVIHSRNHQWLKRWVRLLLKSLENWQRKGRRGALEESDFLLRSVPRMLHTWGEFAGAKVKYDLPTGVLEIALQSNSGILRAARRKEVEWQQQEEITENTKPLVGEALLRSSKSVSSATKDRTATGTTNRLKKTRQQAVAKG